MPTGNECPPAREAENVRVSKANKEEPLKLPVQLWFLGHEPPARTCTGKALAGHWGQAREGVPAAAQSV